MLRCKSTDDPLGLVVRVAAIGACLLRHARMMSAQGSKPMEIRPDVLGRLVLRLVSRLYDASGLEGERKLDLLRILRAEVLLIRSHFRQHTSALLQRMTEGTAVWDLAAIAQSIRDAQPPFDLTSPARYVGYIEGGEGCLSHASAPVVEDVSRTSTVSTRDPNSLARMDTPCRGSKCHHLQCFDLLCFLLVLQRVAKSVPLDADSTPRRGTPLCAAPCPVCTTKLAVTDLYVDKHQAAALAASPHAASLLIERHSGVITGVTGNVSVQDVDEVDVEKAPKPKRPRDDSGFTVEGVTVSDFRD